MMNRLMICVLSGALSAAGLAYTVPAAAQTAVPLFADSEPVEMTLQLPLRTLVSRRSQRPEVDGTASYTTAAGEIVEFDVEVRTRGRNRLANCGFPPLSLNFRRSQVEGTLLAGQNRLKLVTPCRDGESYEEYLEIEYLIYRMYEELSDYAYRVRPMRMRYIDTQRKNRETLAPAFLLEHIDGLAARVGMTAAEVERVPLDQQDPEALAMLSLFHYVIGNTDWSAVQGPNGEECCHNGDVLYSEESGGRFVVVPYDFDQAGLISTPYASPSDKLPIRSVRVRHYRGFCSANDHVLSAVARFNAARPAIERLVAEARLGESTRERVADYVDESYRILNDAEERESEIFGGCR